MAIKNLLRPEKCYNILMLWLNELVFRSKYKMSGMPIPPSHMRYKTAGTKSISWFHKSGMLSINNYNRALEIVKKEIKSFRHILDFGCGCGRMLRWFHDYPKSCCFYGTDIDESMIAWGKKHIRFANLSVNTPLPPLYYQKNTFDLLYSQSVFTHVDETYQDAWLQELRRVCKPGAVLLLSVHGKHPYDKFESEWLTNPNIHNYKQEYESKGILFVKEDGWKGIFPDFHHTTFHKKSYVISHWGKYFEILDYIEKGSLDYQDIVVCRNIKSEDL